MTSTGHIQDSTETQILKVYTHSEPLQPNLRCKSHGLALN